VKATTDGNIFPRTRCPALGIFGVPFHVRGLGVLVPRSIPMILAIRFTLFLTTTTLSGRKTVNGGGSL